MEENCEVPRRNLADLEKQVAVLRENHIAHLAKDVQDIKIDMATHGADLEWLKKAFWVVGAASVGSLITALMNLLTQ